MRNKVGILFAALQRTSENLPMFKSYFKTAFRFLLKNKTFSLINIAGLAIGTLCCVYILLYVTQQYNYDKHHQHAAQIYRITSAMDRSGDKHHFAKASPPIGPALKQDFSEVTQYARLVQTDNMGVMQHLLRFQETSIYEKGMVFVDSTFFDVFSYHFIYGSPTHSLDEPYTIVLMASTAEKLFGKENPVNKLIEIDDSYGKHDFKVTGVIDESLGKSHISGNMFVSMNSGGIGSYVLSRKNDWAGNNFVATYVVLSPKTNVAALEKKLHGFLQKYGHQNLKELGMQKQLYLQPVSAIHTSKGFESEPTRTVNPAFLYVLLLIAVLIQFIACINFMNLSTARASKRAMEVGIRKVMGAGKGELVKQFLGESFLLSLTGVLIAIPLLSLCLPLLNQITQADIRLSMLRDLRLWTILAGLIFLTGLVAGSYPAFYLSAFKAIKVIKGNFSNHISASGLRRAMVVFQFVLSIVLITGIIVIYYQLNYLKNKDLGFDKEQKLVFTFYTKEAINKIPAFMDGLQQLPEVKAVSRSNSYPSQDVLNDWPFYLPGQNMATAQLTQFMLTDEYFVKATGIRLASGRDFRSTDSGKVLINETLAKKLGLDVQKAPGSRILSDQLVEGGPLGFEVAGVMKDFNYGSLHEMVRPFLLMYYPTDNMPHVILNTNSKDYKALLDKISGIWQKNMTGVPFAYAFMDDEIRKLYETEVTLSHIINSFTLMAILISCLGLFGLAAFSAEQRTKEIGIRKVLGASVGGIVQLLSKDFLKLVLIAIVIATPIAWWAMSNWLQGYAYRVNISWWMFALAGFLAVIIALCTVSFQAVKAALMNPVKSLKGE